MLLLCSAIQILSLNFPLRSSLRVEENLSMLKTVVGNLFVFLGVCYILAFQHVSLIIVKVQTNHFVASGKEVPFS